MDSVWHDGLLYKLLQINVGGNFYDLIKNLYYNSTGSVRIGDSQTQPFQCARGVRQGCILSPLLFNPYINDSPYSFENISSDPFVLPNGTKLSCLLWEVFTSHVIKTKIVTHGTNKIKNPGYDK